MTGAIAIRRVCDCCSAAPNRLMGDFSLFGGRRALAERQLQALGVGQEAKESQWTWATFHYVFPVESTPTIGQSGRQRW